MWWLRPTFSRTSPIGVRPNSPPQTTSVASSRPRAFRSLTRAAQGRSISRQTLSRSGLEVLARAAVVVPVGVVELHEPHAALDQPPGQQAVVGERRLARLGAVQVERRLRLARQVDQLRGAGLHPVGHLVGGDPRGDLRVAGGVEPLGVEVADRVERPPLAAGVDPGRAGEVEDRLAAAAERHALVRASAGSRCPQLTAPPRGPRGPDCRTTKPGRSRDSLPIP